MDDEPVPLNHLDDSANPDQLENLTWMEMSDGSKPLVTKTGSGRMSPVRARTMKEYDSQIAELKKENFSLKLRIYFLEEKVQQKFDGEGEDLFKTNIELKVEVESLKRELLDKQDLLKKASTALESISAQHRLELDQAYASRDQTSDQTVQEIQAKLVAKDGEIDDLKRQLEGLGYEADRALGHVSKLEEKDRYIQQLQSALNNRERDDDNDMLREAQMQIEELKKEAAEYRADKRVQELDVQLQKLENENLVHEENALKRDKAIQGLVNVVEQKNLEIDRLNKRVNDALGGRESRTTELELEDRVAELETLLREKQQENERIQKAIARRESEVNRLTQQLEKADDKLRDREDALQDVREQLREEKRRNTEKVDSMTNHYQAMLDDAQRQVQNQEKILQHLSKSLQDKDRQLHDYMHMVQEQKPSTEKQDAIIANLRNQLRDKEEAIEAAIEDKYKSIEERDMEIRQVKTALRERDRDMERANQALLSTEEAIDALQNESKERDQALRQATAALKAQQRSNEDQEDSHQRAMEEKELLIQRLQNSLKFKDKSLQDSIRASPSATDALMQQMQQRLQEKDNLLQEVMLERSRVAETGESSTREMLTKLRNKDREMKEAQEKATEQVADLTHQIQALQSDLNKKDCELQTLENRATWSGEQQQETLDKMRAAIMEKDKTIETLVESARQKDRLFTQMREQSPDIFNGSSASKLAELQQAKDEVARLENEVRKKEDLIDRLRLAAERRSPKPDMVPRRQLDDAEEELARRTEDLTLALRGEKEAKRAFNDLRRQLQEAGEEIERLRKQVERPGTPQRLQTIVGGETNLHLTQMLRDQLQEAQRLSDALRSEREIYININQVGNAPQSDQSRAFEIELSAVQSLRQQLSDGVERNNRIRSALEAQLATNEQNRGDPSGEGAENPEALKAQVTSLATQLEESKRWNTSLQTRLASQPQTIPQQRAVGVGATQDMAITTPIMLSPQRPSSGMSHFNDTLGFSTSLLPSFRQLPEFYSEVALTQMSVPELKTTVMQLQEQLAAGQANCEELKEQLSNAVSQLPRDVPGEDNIDGRLSLYGAAMSPAELKSKVTDLEHDVQKLREKLRHTEYLNDLLKKQIALNTQTDTGPSGFNPELLVEMANEIQRLKDELDKRRQSTSHSGNGTGPPPSPLGKNGAEAQKALQKQMESIRSDYNEEKEDSEDDMELQNKKLSNKLASTEATVRSQTEKVRYYRRLLEENGLLTPLHRRSCSESSLCNLADSPKPPVGRKGRLSSMSTGNLSGSQAISEEMIPKLKGRKSLSGGHKTLAKLRHRVEECRDLSSEMTSQKVESASLRISRMGSLRDKLGEAANLCTNLAVHLDGVDDSRSGELDGDNHPSNNRETPEKQLDKSSSTPQQVTSESTTLMKKLAQLSDEHAVISERNTTLESEVSKLRKQLAKEQKRWASEQEQLTKTAEERDQLNANLRELLDDHQANQAVAQKLQAELLKFRDLHLENQRAVSRMTHKMQRLKAENKRLRSVAEEKTASIDSSRMSIERARHKTGDSTAPMSSPEQVVLQENTAALSGTSPQWEHPSRKMSSSSSPKLSPASQQSLPEVERMRHMTDGSEVPMENGLLLNMNGTASGIEENLWTSGLSSSPDKANAALRLENERLSKEVVDLQARLEYKSGEVSESEAKHQEALRDLRRLSEEVTRLHQELEEKHELNTTLQMELNVYDHMHNDVSQRLSDAGLATGDNLTGGDGSGLQIDLTMLLEELRQLKRQLVQSIENNNVLRQKLEEQLNQQPTRMSHHHFYMNGSSTNDLNRPGYHPMGTSFTYPPFGETYLDRTERYMRVSAPGMMANGHVSAATSLINNPPPNTTVAATATAATDNNGLRPPDQMDRLHETQVKSYENGVDQIDRGLTTTNGIGGYKDRNMTYSIHDPMRPPNGSTANGHRNIGTDQDLSQNRVGSDLRSLYAIGELDEYELLKKEIDESISLLKGTETRVKERLKQVHRASPTQNVDQSTLRAVSTSLEQLAFTLQEQDRLIGRFWTEELPRPKDGSSPSVLTLQKVNYDLQKKLCKLQARYNEMKKSHDKSEQRIKELNCQKENSEASIVKKVIRHRDTLAAVETNLERR